MTELGAIGDIWARKYRSLGGCSQRKRRSKPPQKNADIAAAISIDAQGFHPRGLNMSAVLLVIVVLVGILAMVVLAALIHGAGSYLKSRWRDLTSGRRKQRPSIRNQTVGR